MVGMYRSIYHFLTSSELMVGLSQMVYMLLLKVYFSMKKMSGIFLYKKCLSIQFKKQSDYGWVSGKYMLISCPVFVLRLHLNHH